MPKTAPACMTIARINVMAHADHNMNLFFGTELGWLRVLWLLIAGLKLIVPLRIEENSSSFRKSFLREDIIIWEDKDRNRKKHGAGQIVADDEEKQRSSIPDTTCRSLRTRRGKERKTGKK